jgi:hypothetical protein
MNNISRLPNAISRSVGLRAGFQDSPKYIPPVCRKSWKQAYRPTDLQISIRDNRSGHDPVPGVEPFPRAGGTRQIPGDPPWLI